MVSVLIWVHVLTKWLVYRGMNIVLTPTTAGVKWPGNNHIFGRYTTVEEAKAAIDEYFG